MEDYFSSSQNNNNSKNIEISDTFHSSSTHTDRQSTTINALTTNTEISSLGSTSSSVVLENNEMSRYDDSTLEIRLYTKDSDYKTYLRKKN